MGFQAGRVCSAALSIGVNLCRFQGWSAPSPPMPPRGKWCLALEAGACVADQYGLKSAGTLMTAMDSHPLSICPSLPACARCDLPRSVRVRRETENIYTNLWLSNIGVAASWSIDCLCFDWLKILAILPKNKKTKQPPPKKSCGFCSFLNRVMIFFLLFFDTFNEKFVFFSVSYVDPLPMFYAIFDQPID